MIDSNIKDTIKFLNKQGYKINISKVCNQALKEYIEETKYD